MKISKFSEIEVFKGDEGRMNIVDDNRFGSLCAAATPAPLLRRRVRGGADGWRLESRCHFTSTGMPYTAVCSPRLSKVCGGCGGCGWCGGGGI